VATIAGISALSASRSMLHRPLAAAVGGGVYTQTLGSSSRVVSLLLVPPQPIRTRNGLALVTALRCTLSGHLFTVVAGGASSIVKVDGSPLVLSGAVLNTNDGWSPVTLGPPDVAIGLEVSP
jgi:hypothetical protein